MNPSVSILLFIFLSFLAPTQTLRIQNQNLSHKALIKNYHQFSAILHHSREQDDSDFIAEPPVDNPAFLFFQWLLSPDGIAEAYGKNQKLTPELSDRVKAYMKENPGAMTEILSTQDNSAECFSGLSDDQKNKFAFLVLDAADFSGIGAGTGVKFQSDKVKTIKDTLDADEDFSSKSDKCVSILPSSD